MTTSDTRDVEATVAEVRLRTDPPLDVLLPLIPKEYRRQIIPRRTRARDLPVPARAPPRRSSH